MKSKVFSVRILFPAISLLIAFAGPSHAQQLPLADEPGGSYTADFDYSTVELGRLLAAVAALEIRATAAVNAARWESAESNLADRLYRFLLQIRYFNRNLLEDNLSPAEARAVALRLSNLGRLITNELRLSATSKQLADRWIRVARDLDRLATL